MYSGCVGGVDRLEGAGGSRGNFGLLSSHASGIILIIMMKKPIGSMSDWFIFLMETILASFRNHNKMSINRLIFFRSRKWTCLLWKKRFDRMRKIQGKLLSTPSGALYVMIHNLRLALKSLSILELLQHHQCIGAVNGANKRTTLQLRIQKKLLSLH